MMMIMGSNVSRWCEIEMRQVKHDWDLRARNIAKPANAESIAMTLLEPDHVIAVATHEADQDRAVPFPELPLLIFRRMASDHLQVLVGDMDQSDEYAWHGEAVRRLAIVDNDGVEIGVIGLMQAA
jgi:hypothetical protein